MAGPGRSFLAAVLGVTAVATTATAGSFSVSPVRATLSAQNTVESLTVRNNGAEPAVVQLEVLSWSQDENAEDVLSSTREILATPPIFTVPAGGTQVIRVGLRRSVEPGRELSFRLFLQEVPPAPKPGFQGLQVALRLSIPVFVSPSVAAAPVMRWQTVSLPTGQLRVHLKNDGNAHVQIATFKLTAGTTIVLADQQVSAYVLPGRSRHWVVKPARPIAPGTAVRLSAATDSGDVASDIVVENP